MLLQKKYVRRWFCIYVKWFLKKSHDVWYTNHADQAPDMEWHWSFHQRSSLIKDGYWWCHQLGHETSLHFTNQKMNLGFAAKSRFAVTFRFMLNDSCRKLCLADYQCGSRGKCVCTGWSMNYWKQYILNTNQVLQLHSYVACM